MPCKNDQFFNECYIAVGTRLCDASLSNNDGSKCLEAIVREYPSWRVRTSEQFLQQCLTFIAQYRAAFQAFDSLSHWFNDDWKSRNDCRTEYLYVAPSWPCRTASELHTQTERFVQNWLRTYGQQPENFADIYLRQRQETGKEISLDDVLGLIDTSGYTEPWDYPVETRSVTFVDLSIHQPGAILKIGMDFLPILQRLVPFHMSNGRLYKSGKRTNRDGSITYTKIDLQEIAAAFQRRNYDGREPLPHSDDYLDWTANLLFTNYKGYVPDDDGEPRFHRDFRENNIALVANEDWLPDFNGVACFLPDKPVKPTGASPVVDDDKWIARSYQSRGDYRNVDGEKDYGPELVPTNDMDLTAGLSAEDQDSDVETDETRRIHGKLYCVACQQLSAVLSTASEHIRLSCGHSRPYDRTGDDWASRVKNLPLVDKEQLRMSV